MAKAEIALVPQALSLPTYTFDEKQLEAIAHRGSPLILRGSTGTGKTTVAIQCAIDRIKNGAPANSILFLTFGRENAATARDAIVASVEGTIAEPNARTFHSLAFSILSHKSGEKFIESVLISGAEQESLIRDLLQGDIAAGYKSWPSELHKTDAMPAEPMQTTGFVRELRDLMMRATERNVSTKKLRDMGQRLGQKYWSAAADFIDQYEDVSGLMSDSAADSKLRIDPAQLMIHATQKLIDNPDLRQQLRNTYTTIIVDEFHESDPAQRNLLLQLAGEDLTLIIDPAVTVGRFRGSDPDKVNEWAGQHYADAKVVTLDKVHRPVPRACIRQSQTASEDAQYIAYAIKKAHLIEKIPYSDIAVIVRSHGSTSTAIRRALGQAGIPVEGDRETIMANASIAPFLLMAKIATGVISHLTFDHCEQLLTSEFGGANSLSLRRLRTALLHSRTQDDRRTSADIIRECITSGDIPIEDSQELQRVHTLLAHAQKAARKKGATIHDVLGAIWDNAVNADGRKISEAWQNSALKGGVRGAAADRDLDAMIQLFDSAARHMDRFPGSNPQRFLEDLSHQEIVSDVISYQGLRPDVVEILTVHNTKGRTFSHVFVAGLQDGLWPNLKQRSSLLGSEILVERLRHSEEISDLTLQKMIAESLLEDEKRLFDVAITRASREVVLTAFNHDEDIPSQFFTEALESGSYEVIDSQPPRAITASALVAALRRTLHSDDRAKAASLLAALSHEGISIAHPDNWTGALPLSTDAPLKKENEEINLSPSAADSFEKCELKWLLEKNGGTNGDSARALLGSIIHEYARITVEEKDITDTQLLAQMTELWPTISDTQGWVGRRELARAAKLLARFFEYHEASKNKIYGVEKNFEFTLGRTVVRGSIDRIEVTTDDKYIVVDFKTGTPISGKESPKNLQLACYQLAVILNSLEKTVLPDNPQIAQSQLVFLGATAEKTESMNRYRAPIELDAVAAQIQDIAERMAGSTFVAKKNSLCETCAVRIACPIFHEGKTVISK